MKIGRNIGKQSCARIWNFKNENLNLPSKRFWTYCELYAEVTKMVTFADRKRKELTLDSNLMEISVKLLLGQKICTSIGKIDVIFSHTHQVLSALAYFDLKSMPRRQNWHFSCSCLASFLVRILLTMYVQKLLVCYSFYS